MSSMSIEPARYRSYAMTGPNVLRLGLYGFGAAAHILIQVAKYEWLCW